MRTSVAVCLWWFVSGCCCGLGPAGTFDEVKIQVGPRQTVYLLESRWGCTFDVPPVVRVDGAVVKRTSDGGSGITHTGRYLCGGPAYRGSPLGRKATVEVEAASSRIRLELVRPDAGIEPPPARMRARPGQTLRFPTVSDRPVTIWAAIRPEGSRDYEELPFELGPDQLEVRLPTDLPPGTHDLTVEPRVKVDPVPGCPLGVTCEVDFSLGEHRVELVVREKKR